MSREAREDYYHCDFCAHVWTTTKDGEAVLKHVTPLAASPALQRASSRRRHPRVSGPFDGRRVELLTVPLRIHDLSLGGCLIQAHHEQPPGRLFTMEIELPVEGWVEMQAESLYVREGYGFAARFVQISDDARLRLERTIARLGASQTPR